MNDATNLSDFPPEAQKIKGMNDATNLSDFPPEAQKIIAQLRQEIQQLQRENQDLQITLSTTAEHGDWIEAELHDTNQKLAAEMMVRVQAESTLKTLFEMISRQKEDLEIIVQTLMEHGDVLDNQWYQKFNEASIEAGLDGLTQIPNRRQFDEYFARQWQQMAQAQLPLSVIMGDIDLFKLYNDTYGHLAGDACLKQVAIALYKCLHHPHDLVARYGGEEFILVLPQTELTGAKIVAARIQTQLALLQIPHQNSSVAPMVTVSLGVASVIPQATIAPATLIQQADRQLYQAKAQGRNCISCQDVAESWS